MYGYQQTQFVGGGGVGGGGAMVAGGGGGGGAMVAGGRGAMVAGGGGNGGAVLVGGGGAMVGGGGAGGAMPMPSGGIAVPMPSGGGGVAGGCCAVPGGGACSALSNDNCGVACGTGGGAQFGWVGPYGGSYTTETQYRYVGPGLGEFDYVKPVPNYCVCVLSSSVILLLLLLLGWFLLKDNTSTTTAFVPVGPIKICLVWGDPHVTTFDGAKASYYTPGEFWIVKSDTVKIQGRYRPTHATNGLSVMKEIAIGGSFVQDKVIIVTATSATFAGQQILMGFPSTFDGASMGLAGFSAQLNSQGETLQTGRNVANLRIVHLTLPNNVNIQINRWTEPAEGTYINAKISMPAQPNMDGHCGNFNGNQADDARIQVRLRVGKTGVAQNQMLFAGAKYPVGQSSRYDINDCPKLQLESAKMKCKAKEHKFIPSMGCLIDVCVGGAGFAAEGN